MAVGSAMTAAAAPESILACADEAADEAAGAAAVADMLAAMAAAAIASGAVALPEVGGEVGGAAGVFVTATVTGIAVAMAFVTVAAFCCAEAAGSVEEPVAEASPVDDVAGDFVASDFELPDVALEGWGASALVPVLALVGGAAAEAFWLLESLLAGGAAAAPFCDPPLFAAAGALSEGDCRAGCGGAAAAGLLASLAVLLLTSAPKISFPGLESDLAARGGAL
jgi:hypothetical protein